MTYTYMRHTRRRGRGEKEREKGRDESAFLMAGGCKGEIEHFISL